MKNKFIFFSLMLVAISTFILSCKKDEKTEDEKQADFNTEIMKWMYDNMDEVYYWSDNLPTYNSVKSEIDPLVFFDKLIYSAEDKWSWVTSDYSSLLDELAGTPVSVGISPVFGQFTGTNKVFILIVYVYPGSPADLAGLKRGDIILRVNGADLTTSNYYTLFSLTSFSVTLGQYSEGSISLTSTTINLTAQTIDSDPLIYDTVFEINNRKIAYIVYVEFISGVENNLLDEFGALMDECKEKDITDMIIDLRYNPGGEISAANYLASCLAPQSTIANNEIFVKFQYNSFVQTYFETNEGQNSTNLVNRFSVNNHNLNLDHICFLTGNNTASASELLMVGLDPYMDVTLVGEATYGKYTGAWVIADTNDPPKHNYAIVPIVNKYLNASGFTDFKNGLSPDYLIEDQLIDAKQFGDLSDPVLGKAVEVITGMPGTVKKAATPLNPFTILPNPEFLRKAHLYMSK